MNYKKEIDRLIKLTGVKAVNRISDPIRVEDAFAPKIRQELTSKITSLQRRVKNLQEMIRVQADSPEEAKAFIAMLQNAGMMDRSEMPTSGFTQKPGEMPHDEPQGDEPTDDEGPQCGIEAEAEGEIAQGADYANSPDEDYEDDPMNTYSSKWNHQKKFRRTNNAGDNPLSLADSLMREWTDNRDTEETEEVIDPRIKERQVGEEEAIDPVWGDWGYTPESWSDAKVEDNADYIIAMSKGQAPDIGSWDSTFDSLQDGLPDMDIEGSKYDPNDIIEMLDDTIGGKVTYVVGQYLQEKEDTGELGPPSPEVQKAALEVVNNPEFKKAVSRIGSGQQEQAGDEELKRYGNYRRRN